ncbi:MAG: VOC family protein [Betaproteobacteria bacterium]
MTTPAANPIPNGMHTITPHIVCGDAAAAIEFYKEAFGAIEMFRLAGPDGKIVHAMVRIGDSPLMLMDQFEEMGAKGPKILNGSPVMIHLSVTDADASFRRAQASGAIVRMPVADMFWGARYGVLEDPFGHTWSIATQVRDLSHDEIAAAMLQAAPCGPGQGG